jgi:5-methylthioadenosine/S-adenosylhomocysteine deaminase
MEGAHVLTLNGSGDQYAPGQVTWQDGTVVSVGPQGSDSSVVDQLIHVTQGYVLPGLLNGHNHAAMTLFRGLADDSPLTTWLTDHIFPREAKLTADDVYCGTLLAAAEMIHSGTVGFADMYFQVDAVARAVEVSGLRGWIARGITGDGDSGRAALEDAVAFAGRWRNHARIIPMLGPHAPYTVTRALAEAVARAAGENELGIHIHLAEGQTEIEDLSALGQTPFTWAKSVGLLDHRTLIAHGVFVTDADLPLLQRMRGGIIACPVSNAKLGNGIMPYRRLRAAGVAVGLGTDGAASTNTLDMFEEMKAMAWFQKLTDGHPEQFKASHALAMATVGSAAVLGHDGGVLAPGRPADFILVEASGAHMTPEHDPVANLVYAANGHDVRYTVVDGKILMAEGIITAFDERAVVQEARQRAAHLTA